MKRLSIALVAVGAVMALGPSVAAAHKVHYDSTVTIDFLTDPYSTTFFGNVDSEKNACRKRRTVKVQRDEGNNNVLFGTDTTDNDGDYSVSDAPAPDGAYFAKAKKRFLKNSKKHKHICDADKSPVIELD